MQSSPGHFLSIRVQYLGAQFLPKEDSILLLDERRKVCALVRELDWITIENIKKYFSSQTVKRQMELFHSLQSPSQEYPCECWVNTVSGQDGWMNKVVTERLSRGAYSARGWDWALHCSPSQSSHIYGQVVMSPSHMWGKWNAERFRYTLKVMLLWN